MPSILSEGTRTRSRATDPRLHFDLRLSSSAGSFDEVFKEIRSRCRLVREEGRELGCLGGSWLFGKLGEMKLFWAQRRRAQLIIVLQKDCYDTRIRLDFCVFVACNEYTILSSNYDLA
jgi:hypothetical protein